MDYIQGLSAQTEIFLLALGFGFILGILYDVFRTLRMIISDSPMFTFFMDIMYFLLCTFLLFCFNLAVDSGKIRLYVLLGDVLGWMIYYFSFGEISVKVSNAAVLFVRRTVSVVFKPFFCFFNRMKRKLRKFVLFFKKIIRKFKKKAKYDLQKHKGMVYNLNDHIGNTISDKDK